MIKKICANKECSQEFLVYRYREKSAKFCSHKCYGQNMIGKIAVTKGRKFPERCGENSSQYKHGLNNKRFYKTWSGMLRRCRNKNDIGYKNYGAKGIKVLWKDVTEFQKDMYRTYLSHVKSFGESDTQIERIDNNGNYCRENCRWATRKEQARNRHSNRFVTYKSETKTIAEWLEALGINYIRKKRI